MALKTRSNAYIKRKNCREVFVVYYDGLDKKFDNRKGYNLMFVSCCFCDSIFVWKGWESTELGVRFEIYYSMQELWT